MACITLLLTHATCLPPPQVVYDCGPVAGHKWEDFDTVRARAAREWSALPKAADVISASLQAKVQQQVAARGKAAGC